MEQPCWSGFPIRMKADNLPRQESPEARAARVQAMFTRIAPRYDLMNRLMTGGQDIRWRKLVVQLAQIPPGGRLLDLGAGTGDLTREALRQQPDCHPTAADFTLSMMQAGKGLAGPVFSWSAADALNLPFPDASFDAVVSGFLLRNVVDLQRALREQYRVLKPGGRMVALDTTRPHTSALSPFIRFHMHRIIPFLGRLLTGEHEAYVYLPETSEHFLRAEDLRLRVKESGFGDVDFKRLMFGTIAVHWGRKPI
jgi:demethylmenaquinone methyltransferase / 2-methoxy-6-polyprenyl-1,4-benzoquinol methylase